MATRRKNIQNLIGNKHDAKSSNASLWLDKFIFDSRKNNDNDKNKGKSEASYLDKSKKDETAKAELVEKVVSITEPTIYKTYFENTWHSQLHNFGAKCRKAKVKNRLAINLGSESVLETNISLHRVFGVPFIAGSSLKGMTAAFIRQYGDWKKDGDFYITVFGDENNAGFITFYDALYIPETGFPDKNGVKRPLYSDVMTTHHQDYYGEKKDSNKKMLPPADWDSPNPVPFISATGEYLIALSAPEGCENWIELAFDILGFALTTEGIGAKTSSGYGRLKLQNENGNYTNKYEIQVSTQSNVTENNTNSGSSQTQLASESERIAKSYIQRINALRETDVASQIPNFAKECLTLEDESAKRQVAQAIKQRVIDSKREKKSIGKKWYDDIIPFTEDADWVVEAKK